MKIHSILTALLMLAALLYGQSDAVAGAPNIASGGLESFGIVRSSAIKIGDGCGWEYPCAPRPYFGRKRYHRPLRDRVEIRNNYGVVNVYVNGHRRYGQRPSYRPSCNATSCRFPEEAAPAREDSCEASNCESCGPWCWYQRARAGYCGHGCEWYRESARIESEEEPEHYPRQAYKEPRYREQPPPHQNRNRDIRDESLPELPTPRRPYVGPPYPAQ